MLILFDVNGTLLDTAALADPLHRIFKKQLTVDHFFTQLLQYSMAATLAGNYHNFTDFAAATLEMNAVAQGIKLSAKQIETVLTRMRRLPPFPDVKAALQRLRDSGYRLATLTNSNPDTLKEQLRQARLTKYFGRTLSIEAVRKYKPAAETYRYAAKSLGVEAKNVLMVAAHHWDLMGAAAEGFHTALITRPGHARFPAASEPTYIANDLTNLTAQLLGEATAPAPPVTANQHDNRALLGTCALAVGMASILIPAIAQAQPTHPS